MRAGRGSSHPEKEKFLAVSTKILPSSPCGAAHDLQAAPVKRSHPKEAGFRVARQPLGPGWGLSTKRAVCVRDSRPWLLAMPSGWVFFFKETRINLSIIRM